MEKVEFILHAGGHKTGSTSLQNFLYKNKRSLIKQGVLYPDLLPNEGFINHNWMADVISENEELCKKHGFYKFRDIDLYAQLMNQISKFKPKKIIISGEAFARVIFIEFSERFFNFINLFNNFRIVFYHRCPISLAQSLYNQAIKGGSCPDKDRIFESLKRQAHDNHWYNKLRKVSDRVGVEQLVVRPYAKSKLYNGDIISDFSYFLGINLKSLVTTVSVAESNPKIPSQYINFCYYMNSLTQDRTLSEKRMTDLMLVALQSEKISDQGGDVFSQDQLSQLYLAHQTKEQRIAEEFMGIEKSILSAVNFVEASVLDKIAPSSEEIAKEVIIPLLDAIARVRQEIDEPENLWNQMFNFFSLPYKLLSKCYKSLLGPLRRTFGAHKL